MAISPQRLIRSTYIAIAQLSCILEIYRRLKYKAAVKQRQHIPEIKLKQNNETA